LPTRIAAIPRSLMLAVVAVLAIAAAGCGQEEDPAALLQAAFDTPIESATTTVTARANLRGSSPQTAQPLGLRISGPYKRNAENQLPSLDFQVSASQGPGALNASSPCPTTRSWSSRTPLTRSAASAWRRGSGRASSSGR
jgi:hypothetical protein